ncbi:MAG TPA: protein-disulfide reductase DsbD [Burkholderiales bacterium]|nr:protein-disulfide reductase DsbD [Burkholderiales bacterium]
MRLLFFLLMLFSLPACAAEPELLEPEKAFRFSAEMLDPGNIEVRYQIAEGYYLYRERFRFEVQPAGFSLGKPQIPAGEIHQDQFFGRVETYRRDLKIKLPLKQALGPSQTLTLKAVSQGCADAGVCYTPLEQSAHLSLVAATSQLPAAPATIASLQGLKAAASPSPLLSSNDPAANDESSQIANLLRVGSFWFIVASFFGFGLLLAFTPCVFPMIPILSGIIVGQKQTMTKARGLVLSGAYVLGVAITYAIAGVAAGLSGTLLSNALQNAWVLGAFAALFVALALSMFGFYELQFPASVQGRLNDAANRIKAGNLAGAFVMGGLSALIVGPCVAAPLAGALLYISQSRDVVLGGSSLFAMALGMGVPLLAVGISAGTLLPKAGPWMDAVKRFFGVLLLGVAIWIISPLISLQVHMALWATLLIVWAVYLKAVDPLPAEALGYARLGKGIGIIALVAGIALLVGVFSGERDILRPLARLNGPIHLMQGLKFQRVKSNAELDQAVAQAGGKYVMYDFYADWCVSCKEMERFTFTHPAVQAKLKDVVLLQADVTANTAEDAAMLKRFGLFGPPGTLFFDKQGNEIKGVRVVGYQSPEKFLATLDAALK